MDAHENARPTYPRGLEMVREITEQSINVSQAALRAGVKAATACKWLGRYLVGDEAALVDASSRPARSPRTIVAATALAIVERHRFGFMPSLLALRVFPRAPSVVCWLVRGCRFERPDAAEPVVRYEQAAPGDLRHIDTRSSAASSAPATR